MSFLTSKRFSFFSGFLFSQKNLHTWAQIECESDTCCLYISIAVAPLNDVVSELVSIVVNLSWMSGTQLSNDFLRPNPIHFSKWQPQI